MSEPHVVSEPTPHTSYRRVQMLEAEVERLTGELENSQKWIRKAVALQEHNVRVVAEREQAWGERDMLRTECASISEEFGLPATIRPAEGEIKRFMDRCKTAEADLARVTQERDRIVAELHATHLAHIAHVDQLIADMTRALAKAEMARHDVDAAAAERDKALDESEAAFGHGFNAGWAEGRRVSRITAERG